MRIALLSLLILVVASLRLDAAGLTRADAVAQLRHEDAQVRRAAVDRLAEIGTIDDAPPLVKALRDEDADVRSMAEQALWRVWARSGDPDVDALYATGMQQMEAGDAAAAIDTFTRIIERRPAFAEAWNKRATLYFLTGDLRRSLADCDQVIKRNPQHFGALAGYAQIYARLEYFDRALDYSRRALAVNPNLEAVRRNIEVLEHVIEQRRRQSI